jgi:hypothetical protein
MGNAAHRSGSIYRAILFSITILFALTLLADWFIPPYRATGTGMVFRSSYSLASALLVVALLFTLLVVFLEVITRSQRRDKSLTKNLLLKRVVVGLGLVWLGLSTWVVRRGGEAQTSPNAGARQASPSAGAVEG